MSERKFITTNGDYEIELIYDTQFSFENYYRYAARSLIVGETLEFTLNISPVEGYTPSIGDEIEIGIDPVLFSTKKYEIVANDGLGEILTSSYDEENGIETFTFIRTTNDLVVIKVSLEIPIDIPSNYFQWNNTAVTEIKIGDSEAENNALVVYIGKDEQNYLYKLKTITTRSGILEGVNYNLSTKDENGNTVPYPIGTTYPTLTDDDMDGISEIELIAGYYEIKLTGHVWGVLESEEPAASFIIGRGGSIANQGGSHIAYYGEYQNAKVSQKCIFTFKKVDLEGNPLSGAQFSIYDSNDNLLIITGITGDDGYPKGENGQTEYYAIGSYSGNVKVVETKYPDKSTTAGLSFILNLINYGTIDVSNIVSVNNVIANQDLSFVGAVIVPADTILKPDGVEIADEEVNSLIGYTIVVENETDGESECSDCTCCSSCPEPDRCNQNIFNITINITNNSNNSKTNTIVSSNSNNSETKNIDNSNSNNSETKNIDNSNSNNKETNILLNNEKNECKCDDKKRPCRKEKPHEKCECVDKKCPCEKEKPHEKCESMDKKCLCKKEKPHEKCECVDKKCLCKKEKPHNNCECHKINICDLLFMPCKKELNKKYMNGKKLVYIEDIIENDSFKNICKDCDHRIKDDAKEKECPKIQPLKEENCKNEFRKLCPEKRHLCVEELKDKYNQEKDSNK